MKPLVLKGHERALTCIKFNREGDLLFSSAKDNNPCVWFAENGERLGTYDGHNGVIWHIDVSWDNSLFLSGSGDNFCKLWDTQTGKCRHSLSGSTSIRRVGFSYSGNLFFYSTDRRTTHGCFLNIFDVRDAAQVEQNEPQLSIAVQKSKITSAVWSYLDYMIIAGHENGEICQYDIRATTSEPVNFQNVHKRQIQDL